MMGHQRIIDHLKRVARFQLRAVIFSDEFRELYLRRVECFFRLWLRIGRIVRFFRGHFFVQIEISEGIRYRARVKGGEITKDRYRKMLIRETQQICTVSRIATTMAIRLKSPVFFNDLTKGIAYRI